MTEPRWPLSERHLRLPKWAQDQMHDLLCEKINAEMDDCIQADVRSLAKRVFGGNCTFADDDAHMLAAFAEAAIDAGLHNVITDRPTLADIEKAKARRADERALASAIEARSDATGTGAAEGESAVPKGDAQ